MQVMQMKKLLFTFVLGAGLLAAQPSHAAFINDIGDDFAIDWFLDTTQNDNDGGMPPIDLSAMASFDVVIFTASSVKLNISFSNTTVLSGATTEAGITTFGIGVSPNATSVTFADTADAGFTDAEIDSNGNFPGGFKNIDICVFTQGCSGGSQGSALAAGASDAFMLTIFGDFSNGGGLGIPGVTLDPFPVKFQTTQGSFEFGGTPPPPGITIPEPSSLALFGVGLLGLGMMRRRRQTA